MIERVASLLNKARQELLDLSGHNRLLNLPKRSVSAKVIHIHDERSSEIYRLLVEDNKSVTFLPAREADQMSLLGKQQDAGDDAESTARDEVLLLQPEDGDLNGGLGRRQSDTKLQTRLTSEVLQRRLLQMYYDARTIIEEQGVNILYLALGQLKYFDAQPSRVERFAPLILVPVALERRSASERFYLRWNQEDAAENLSLAAKLKTDFGIVLPDFKDGDDFDPARYLQALADVVTGQPGWEVQANEIALGFFSFAKFLMYRDLDAANWPKDKTIDGNSLVTALLRDGFPAQAPLFPEDPNVDALVPVPQMAHVIDADGSQTLAIEAVRRGNHLVIQGPPGTGKSQTIANIVAASVIDGKNVLFVAEKMAALDVVKRRLESVGLGPVCLEIHSNKANKRAVLEDISTTRDLGKPQGLDRDAVLPKLSELRDVVNAHAALMHERLEPSGLTPYLILGHLARLQAAGTARAELTIDAPERWSKQEVVDRENALRELATRVQRIGPPGSHPWRGVELDAVLRFDADRLLDRTRDMRRRLLDLLGDAGRLGEVLSSDRPRTCVEVERYCTMAAQIAKAPPLDRTAITSGVWAAGVEGLRALIESGRRLTRARAEIGDQVREVVWRTDLSDIRRHVAASGRSLFRFLNRPYRRSLAELRSMLTVLLPRRFDDRMRLIDAMIDGSRAYAEIESADTLGAAAFGTLWRKDQTDWEQLAAIVDWVAGQRTLGLPDTFRATFSRVEQPDVASQLAKRLEAALPAIVSDLKALVHDLRLDLEAALGATSIEVTSLEEITQRLGLWLEHPEGLSEWIGYHALAVKAWDAGVGAAVEALQSGRTPPAGLVDAFQRAYYEAMLRVAIQRRPQLARFDGAAHERSIDEFRQFDEKRIELARLEAAVSHYDRMPQGASGVGALGVLNGEIARKRGHMPIRKLLRLAGSAVQAIKPVFMMSPLSVAQYLEPGAIDFDLLVIDEASQVQPVDALGAIARARQIVVVGDDKQLPPTRFFMRMTSETDDDPDDEEGVASVGDIESILGLCVSKGLPQRMLRWHYRSRHHSLIAVSNAEFYDNGLFIVPSPYSVDSGLGLKFHHVANGIFDSGATAVNRIEARAVAQAVIDHARRSPDLSLGVAAFSVKQRQVIMDELELLRRRNMDVEGFFTAHPTEPFFVKNLENVQGDERDVILISVGYGRNPSGYMAMRFGPLSADGGERRLNVLISRAKRRCEVFSSVTADDIDLERGRGRGVAALKLFLKFAQTGQLGLAVETGREAESPFEEAVKRSLEAHGYDVRTQIGVAGFFVDLAVTDSERPGRYILGIECDGAAYHATRSARDRDRLRQAVLEDHGWIIHRIWSTDWFQRPEEQLRRTIGAIEAAKAGFAAAAEPGETESALDSPVLMRGDQRDSEPLVADPYIEASFTVRTDREPHDVPASNMARVVGRIIDEEGPIHEDEIVTRVRALWGLQRAGSRIQRAVENGLRFVVSDGRYEVEERFYDRTGRPVRIRDRSAAGSPTLRRPEMLPPAELRAAILKLIEMNHGAARDEIPTGVASMLGFRATGVQVRRVIERQVAALEVGNEIAESSGFLKLTVKSPLQ